MSECPHCAGVGGYVFDVTFRAVRFERWNGDTVDTDNYVITRDWNYRCVDCDKRITKAQRSAAKEGKP